MNESGQGRPITKAGFAVRLRKEAESKRGIHKHFLLDLAMAVRDQEWEVDADKYTIMRDMTGQKILIGSSNATLIRHIKDLCEAIGVELKQVSTAPRAQTCEITPPRR